MRKGAARGRGSHLSGEGAALARSVGAQLGPVSYVATSQSPRAVETAIAMGFAVDDTHDLPAGYVPGEAGHHDQWTWHSPYRSYAELIRAGGTVAAVAGAHKNAWLAAADIVAEGQVALVISHGGAIEPALVACLPTADHASWGAPFAHCDGARLAVDNGVVTAVEFRRVRLP